MPEIAEIIRTFGPAYRSRFGDRLLPSHARALRDLTACRTEVLGGHLAQCDQCGHRHYAYHSCRNRSCPKCHTADRERWLEKRRTELLPIPYFHVVFTLPAALRNLVSRHQKQLYAVLFQAAAQALLSLSADPRYVGGQIGILSVLHTWTRQLGRHPHVHCLVTGGGLTAEGDWVTARKRYLVPVVALSPLFRARFMALARKALPEETFPDTLWEKDWVVYCKPALQGSRKLLDYLGRYVHRIAITNRRILSIHKEQVTFEYQDSRDNRWKQCRLPGEEFLRRFLQHVLPRGFHKVRYYGLLGPRQRTRLRQLQWLLATQASDPPLVPETTSEGGGTSESCPCPICENGVMLVISWIPRSPRGPP
jgi:Putative transposase/Transposase zinc-binding domain